MNGAASWKVLIALSLGTTGVGQIREQNFDGKALMISNLGAAKSKGVNYSALDGFVCVSLNPPNVKLKKSKSRSKSGQSF